MFSGILLFTAIAAPWHILAGLRNPGAGHPVGNIPTPGNVHGFFYFYFINEQVLRFLGRRYPVDYNKLPFVLYWSLHLVWLFPWSIYLPAVIRQAWVDRKRWLRGVRPVLHSIAERPARFRSRTNWLLALVLCRYPHLLLPLHQPGVLHLSCLFPLAVAHRRSSGKPGKRT